MKKLSTSTRLAAITASMLAMQAGAAEPANPNPAKFEPIPEPAMSPALRAFARQNPEAGFYYTGDRITSVYGPAFGGGASPKDTAQSFVETYSELFSVPAGQLVEGGLNGDGASILPLMQENGKPKFYLVSYLQQVDGVPVFRSDLRLLVRNEEGFPLVLARNSMFDVQDFHVPEGAAANAGLAVAAAQNEAALKYMGMVNFTKPELVVWAGYDDKPETPTLAITFTGTAFDEFNPLYQKRLFVADAATGAILWSEDQVSHSVPVTGTITGNASQGKKADPCVAEVQTPLPYARVVVAGAPTFANVNGFYSSNAGLPLGFPTAVSAEIAGLYFRTHQGGSGGPVAEVQNTVVVAPAVANFNFNNANTNETQRGGVNAYLQANIVRDFALTYAPGYPTIGGQFDWPVNVGVAGTCNAFYNGTSINFFNASPGCANSAFGDVVHHEYGHHLVNVAGSGQGQYGEGMGDVMGVLISDDPIVFPGWFGNCNTGDRNADNNLQYPCAGEIHFCGQLIAGCVWDTRNELLYTNPSNYKDVLAALAVNSIPLHAGDLITPQITIDYLTLDDNDANIANGTPHYSSIAKGFTKHNMAPPTFVLGDMWEANWFQNGSNGGFVSYSEGVFPYFTALKCTGPDAGGGAGFREALFTAPVDMKVQPKIIYSSTDTGSFDSCYYKVNGVKTLICTNATQGTFNPLITLQAGDDFRIGVDSTDSAFGPGVADIMLLRPKMSLDFDDFNWFYFSANGGGSGTLPPPTLIDVGANNGIQDRNDVYAHIGGRGTIKASGTYSSSDTGSFDQGFEYAYMGSVNYQTFITNATQGNFSRTLEHNGGLSFINGEFGWGVFTTDGIAGAGTLTIPTFSASLSPARTNNTPFGFSNSPSGTGGDGSITGSGFGVVTIVGGNASVAGLTKYQAGNSPHNYRVQARATYSTTDSGCFDKAVYIVNGVETDIACNSAPGTYFVQFDVKLGDSWGFGVRTTDGVFGAGTLVIDSLRAFEMQTDAACYPDCDGDSALSIDDFICFQTFFALGDPYADCDGDSALSIDDFICFQTFFAIGC